MPILYKIHYNKLLPTSYKGDNYFMRATDIIAKKRDGLALGQAEIDFMIQGCTNRSIADYQMSAWLMAIYLKGMSFEETGYLTHAMIQSGQQITINNIEPRLLVDKHSTGGVGDKISLPLAPLVAAMGVYVPMMSGRALGITGGTLDKLQSIPGYRVHLNKQEFQAFIQTNGYAMTGQTEDVAPADRILYALRDVTATVESVPLITASILSKKFAEGAQSLIFDVKCGSGAFMKTQEQAKTLATSLIETSKMLQRKAVALITNMSQPLGFMVGNFLEVEESISCLMGQGPDDIMALVYRQAGYMALAAGLVATIDDGVNLAKETLASGKALDYWWKNISMQGGDRSKTEAMIGQYRGQYVYDYKASKSGVIHNISAYTVGHAGIALGVGRNKTDDVVSAAAGFIFNKKVGDEVKSGDVLCHLYADTPEQLAHAVALFEKDAYTINVTPKNKENLILSEILSL